MSHVRIELENELAADDRNTIVDGLIEYNRQQGYVWNRQPLNVVARDADGRVVGGLLAEVNLGWAFVAALWVDSAARGAGVGSGLMRSAETEARRRGCVGIYLDTYSFQARPFYESLGYHLFGELENCPPAGSKYYLCKRLA